MLFSNAVFHDGLNLTVRRGVKWNSVSNNEEIFVQDCNPKPDEVPKKGRITFTQVKVFEDIDDEQLHYEHDDACKTKEGLLPVMKSVYEGFDSKEIVTLVFFELTE